jgi:acetylornithine deacetylase/succinyl-diaminopimelate desuccinylase-like protein
MEDRLQKVLNYIEEHREEYIELLQKFCQQPSIAATGEGIEEMAQMVFDHLDAIGANPERIETGGSPVIYGKIDGESERTFGFYDHYDVQPVDPINEWIDPPFSATIRDGVIYARGVADNKDGLVTRLCAIDAWQKTYGKLPLCVKFLFEGEEEIGSPHLVPFAKQYPEKIQCDGYVWEGGNREEGCPPEIHMGVKGLLYVELHARVSKKDAHSMYAAVMDNAAWRLSWALNTLKSPDGHVLIDGFYDDISPITQGDLDALKDDIFDEEKIKEILGIQQYTGGISGMELLSRLYYMPTCNICGLTAGYQGEGSKTVLPATARAKLDFRLVPGQDPEKILRLLREHLDKNGFSDIEIKYVSGCPAFRTDPDSAFCRAVIRSLEKIYQQKPCIHRSVGGTSPMYAFCKDARIPALMFGASSESANIHAPNEHLACKAFIDMIRITATVMEEFSHEEC